MSRRSGSAVSVPELQSATPRGVGAAPRSLVSEAVSQMSRTSQPWQLSQVSQSAFADPNWSSDDWDQFNERAAILEYDAGLDRGHAEYRARASVDLYRPDQG